ncbi:cytidylate kinase [Octadecabacter temperatus]|uniref:Cytidylate kinase n=1 Tax=Octadecabacter temperatus TaxID=1458307 RepID=A0A0K0Y7N5_9RHOB|nr:(d)CMP kinase [Octadecabacter temperatus]AKS46984.1 Cytidylate kinase [Octadecabacter temperatus]SIO24717.1 cytidylate kinase [Octadecabacter temperatus]
MSFTVAIDGPAAAGKGTISKAVAAHFGFAHLDTGLLYRAVGAKVLHGADPLVAAQTLEAVDLDGDHLRSPEVAQAASKVAVDPDVRAALVAFQRQFAARDDGAVLDGRDIGTVICPNADVKLFVTASSAKRAQRRLDELNAKGMGLEFAEVLADVEARDKRDSERATAPLKPADDAVLLDTSELSAKEAIAQAIAIVQAARV